MQNSIHTRARQRRQFQSRGAFTLLQMLCVTAVIGVLGAVLFGAMGNGRETARRAQCDTQLKAIVLALDAYRQESGAFPQALTELHSDRFLQDAHGLRCPADPRQADDGGYEEFYVIRAARDSDAMPLVVCPFHEPHGDTGMQAFKGRYTTHHPTKPVRVVSALNATLHRPGKNPIALSAGMELRGGDRINTDGGNVVIAFADNSTATLSPGAEITVLQSFLMGQAYAPLYTVIRQRIGEVVYRVESGSKFDVVTPTATSGARGTRFRINVQPSGETQLVVEEGNVAFSTLQNTVLVPVGESATGLLSGIINLL